MPSNSTIAFQTGFSLICFSNLMGSVVEQMDLSDFISKCTVGVPEVDEQHAEIVKQIISLQDAIKQGIEAEQLTGTLNFLGEYLEYHFDAEEKLFKAGGYPDLVRHISLHQGLSAKVDGFLESYLEIDDAEIPEYLTKLLEFLIDWLVKHILDEDVKALTYINAKE